MFAVIFTATTQNLDAQYEETVTALRTLAFEKYRCSDFIAMNQGDEEIAISYWHSMEDIKAWKQDATHLLAQKTGQEKWYVKYRVQVTEVHRDYQFESEST